MRTFLKSLKLAAAGAALSVAAAIAATAQILTVDDDRVEREAAAYKDFNLQTNEIRQNILQLRQFTSRGGTLEQGLADLEKRKSIIGNDKYEEERLTLQNQFVVAQQSLGQLELVFDKLRQEAMVQVERARQPVIRGLLGERDAQIIMLKRLVLGSAAGIDVTTEFIERLDAELPSVTLNMPQRAAPPATPNENNQDGQ